MGTSAAADVEVKGLAGARQTSNAIVMNASNVIWLRLDLRFIEAPWRVRRQTFFQVLEFYKRQGRKSIQKRSVVQLLILMKYCGKIFQVQGYCCREFQLIAGRDAGLVRFSTWNVSRSGRGARPAPNFAARSASNQSAVKRAMWLGGFSEISNFQTTIRRSGRGPAPALGDRLGGVFTLKLCNVNLRVQGYARRQKRV